MIVSRRISLSSVTINTCKCNNTDSWV